ncbi:MAG TPA: CDP-alcohol phosphatidyltransferase [Methylocystis sp.]|nr:CDP-alcohol phosphatidyltransferase [Methylocystis sp.]
MGRFAEFWLKQSAGAHTPDRSFLAPLQRRAVLWLAPKLPDALSPGDLTRLGLLGAIIAAAALLLCRWRFEFVYLVPIGVALNWFGATFDGPLAERRNETGAKVGLAEHLTDLAGLLLMIVAYAFSPFLTFEAAALILVCYLMFSAYTYIRAATGHVEQMALIGVGATEFRLMLALWPFASLAIGVDRAGALTLATAILATMAIAALVLKIVIDAQKIASAGN